MTSTQEGSTAASGSTTKKREKNRRSWTPLEEIALITALKDVKDMRLKSENGFKPGYLKNLEKAIQQHIPKTDLKTNPHITSKLSSWKKHYYSLTAMMKRSGVGFNDKGNHMIDCEDETWEQIVKMDPNARLMRHKSWPYFEDWKEVFGTDLATGENAEDIYEAFIDLQNNDNPTPDVGAHGENECNFENEVNEANYDRVSQSAIDEVPAKKTSSSKRRKVNEDLEGVCELLAEMNEATNARLDKLVTRIGYDYDMGKARQETFEQIGLIPGLSVPDRFIVCELVAFNDKRLEVWRGMNEEARAQYVEHLLKNKTA